MRQVLRNNRTFNGIRREDKAAAATKAAHLIERTSSGIQPLSTDGAVLESVLVAEDARGRGYTAGDEYSADETVPYLECNSGDLVTLLLATGENVTGGEGSSSPTQLVSDNAGGVRAFDSGGGDTEDMIVAVADEDLNNTSGSYSLLNAKVTR
jgi:hypothetical protein